MVLRGDWGLRLIAWLSLYPKMRPFVHGSHGSYGFFRFFMVVSMLIEPNLGPLQPLLHHPDLDQPNVIGSLTACVDAEGRFSVTSSYPLLIGFVTFQAQLSGGLLS